MTCYELFRCFNIPLTDVKSLLVKIQDTIKSSKQ